MTGVSLRLPAELIRPIIENVANARDLFYISQSSRAFNAEAEILLYRAIDVPADQPRRQTLLFTTLAGNQRLALYVTELKICLGVVLTRQLTLITKALAAVKNLRTLDMHIFSGTMPSTRILANCTFQLRRFTCPFPASQDVMEFLARQPELIDLSCTHCWFLANHPRRLSTSDLPRLTYLAARKDVLAAVTPEHPRITHWRLVSEDNLNLSSPFYFLKGQPAVHVLSLVLPGWLPLDTRDILPLLFPQLRYLEAATDLLDEIVVTAVGSNIAGLRGLHTLRLRVFIGRGGGRCQAVSAQLFEGCLSLQVIEWVWLGVNTISASAPQRPCQVWIRGRGITFNLMLGPEEMENRWKWDADLYTRA